MKKKQIGISIAVDTGKSNWNRINDLINFGFNYIELYNKVIRVRLEDVQPLKTLISKKNIRTSFHSMVQDLFCDQKEIAEQEYFTLKGEIHLASMIGCSRVVFHINKKTKLSEKQIKSLKTLSGFAKKLGLFIALENSCSGITAGDYLYELCNKIANLRLCLDIGHLNVAINKGFVKDRSSFLSKIGDKIVELHLSYNSGQEDEHNEIDSHSINYVKTIVKEIKQEDIDCVIETKNFDQAKQTLLSLTE